MRLAALLLSLLALAGCGGAGGEERAPSAGVPGPEGGLTVEQALNTDADGPLLVRGYLVVQGDDLRLCSTLVESDPSRCGEPSLRVEGGPDGIWPADEEVSLVGDVEDGVLRVSETSLAR